MKKQEALTVLVVALLFLVVLPGLISSNSWLLFLLGVALLVGCFYAIWKLVAERLQ